MIVRKNPTRKFFTIIFIQRNAFSNQRTVEQYATIDVNGQSAHLPVTIDLEFNHQPLTMLPTSSSNATPIYDYRNITAAALPHTAGQNLHALPGKI